MADVPDRTPDELGHTATLPARSDSDTAHTATLPARTGAAIPERVAAADINSPAHDLAELPVVDPETYVFGHYFARGGMGRIAAVRDKRLGRVVAIKELLVKDPGLVARFRREIQITAQLQHPAIVSLLEAGQWASGEPFFAMKKVQGQSLKDAIEARKTLDERLGLLASTIAIVDALAYAHDRGIIHRDLKPANVLVGEFGETVVIDWGLAKDLRVTDDVQDPLPSLARVSDAQMTADGAIMGTPSFMAPEQARGEDADERTDVYALGAILYTVLTGKPPYQGGDVGVVMARVLDEPPPAVGDLEPGVPLDLQTIVARAMAREKSARYPSAKELAADLKRFQTGQLVAAHRYTRGELLRRWIRRHRGTLLVAVIALVALGGVGAASVTRIVRERDRARTAELDASGRADALVLAQARTLVESDPLRALKGLADLHLASAHWPAARIVAADAVARGLPKHMWDAHATGDLDISADGRWLAYAVHAELRLRDLSTGNERTLGKHEGEINDLMFSHDSTRIATASQDNTVGVWTLDGAPPKRLRGHAGLVIGVEFTQDDAHVVSSGLDRATRVWSLTSDEVHTIPAMLRSGRTSVDGRWLVGVEPARGSAIWDSRAGTRVLELDDRCAAFTPGTSTVVIAGAGKVVSRDLATGTETELGKLTDRCSEIVIGRDGKVVIGTVVGSVLISDVETKATWVYRGITEPVTGLATRPDGAYVAAWSREGAVHLIEPRTKSGQPLAGSRGEARFIGDDRVVALDAKRQLLAWTTTRGGARVFETSTGARTVAVASDGRTLASGGPGWHLRLTDLATRQTRDLRGHGAPVHHVAFSPNGALIASLAEDHRARLWERSSGQSVELPGRGQANLQFSPDGAQLVAIGDREDISLWNVGTGEVRALRGHQGSVFTIAFGPSAGVLASGGADRTVRMWNLSTGDSRTLGTHDAPIRRVTVSPDGAHVAAVDEAGSVRVWPAAGGTSRTFTGHSGWVLAAAFDRSGRYLATAGTDKTVRLWNVATGAAREVGRHGESVLDVAFSPDALTLASASTDGKVRLWDVASGDHRVLDGHASWVWHVAWFADSTRIVTAGEDATMRVWSDELPREPEQLRDWLVGASAGDAPTVK